MDININEALIKKQILHPGNKYIPLKPGTRVKFHFQTRKCDTNYTILDDSKKMGKPMELVLGKKFKLEVWEVIVQKMALNEVAKFTVDKSLVIQYPFISKTLRDVDKKVEERKHCCGMTIQSEGIGYKDLDELLNNPCDLEFIIELISIELPEDYDKECWQLNDDEKLIAVKDLREKGNKFYKDKNYNNAEKSYMQALGLIEKPHDEEWNELASMKVPLLLNYVQCLLLKKDYYAVIDYCNECLQYDPNNVKALYRRAKAHFGAWNPELAKRDFQRCVELDNSIENTVNKEINAIIEQQRLKDLEDKKKFQKLF